MTKSSRSVQSFDEFSKPGWAVATVVYQSRRVSLASGGGGVIIEHKQAAQWDRMTDLLQRLALQYVRFHKLVEFELAVSDWMAEADPTRQGVALYLRGRDKPVTGAQCRRVGSAIVTAISAIGDELAAVSQSALPFHSTSVSPWLRAGQAEDESRAADPDEDVWRPLLIDCLRGQRVEVMCPGAPAVVIGSGIPLPSLRDPVPAKLIGILFRVDVKSGTAAIDGTMTEGPDALRADPRHQTFTCRYQMPVKVLRTYLSDDVEAVVTAHRSVVKAGVIEWSYEIHKIKRRGALDSAAR